MLLKYTATSPASGFTRRTDPYVPFEIDCASAPISADELFYWRTTNTKYLLEIWILASTGLLGGVSLVLVPREWIRVVESVDAYCIGLREDGLPIVDLTPWKSRIGNREFGVEPGLRRVDEEIPFVFAIGHDGVAVLFEPSEAVSTVNNGDLKFLFAQDRELCGVVLSGLSKMELQVLRNSHGC